MKRKTVVAKLQNIVKDRIPSAGTNQALLIMQSELGKVLRDIKDMEHEEKEQLRQAFNRGVIHGMLQSSSNRSEEVMYGFEQYYRENYIDDKA